MFFDVNFEILYIEQLQNMAQRAKPKQQKKVIDATVIDEQILKKAVRDYLTQNKIIPKQPQINFGKIKVLSLSFLNILKIQYLDALVRLQKLQLDNNIIEKIENIGHLTNLKWLDLSFNKIKSIQGLQSLVNLTDLSLYNNKIMILDGLHNCTKLNIFSIGNNQIRSFEEIIAYFGRSSDKKTRFKYLQVLNVFGNTFTIKDGERDKEYEAHLIANLPNLRYLDYIFIDQKKRKEIRQSDDKFKTQDQAKFLLQLKNQEQKEFQAQEQQKKKINAKMHLLDGYEKDIIKIDDLEKIQKMRGLEQEINNFSNKVKELVDAMQKKIKEQNENKFRDIKKSEEKLFLREKEAEKRSLDAIQYFENERKKFLKLYENKVANKNWKQQATKLRSKIFELKDNLLNIQIELMEDAESLFKKEIIIGIQQRNKHIQIILSQQQKDDKNDETGYFKKIQDQIKQFGLQLERISREQIQRYTNLQNAGQSEQEYSSDPELNSILQNKETIPGTVSTIKELLIQKKSKKESQIDNELCTKDKQAFKKQYEERQYKRNRKNIKHINEKIEELMKEMSQIIAYQQEDD